MKNKVIKKIIRTISAILAVFMLLNSTVLNVLAFQAQQKQYDDIYNMGSETGGSRKADDPYALMYDGNERFAKRVEDIIDVDFGSQPEMDKSSGIDSNESESEIEREEQKTKLRGYAETGDIEGINDMDISEEMKDQISEIYNITQENRFIVKYKSASGKDISSIMKNNSKGIRIKNKAKKGDTELIVLDEKINPKDFAEELKVLSADSEIEYIQPDFIMSYSTYEDEDVDIITEPGNEENDADDANTNDVDPEEIESTDIEPDNDEALEQVIVAVIDTGIDITHPGLTDYIWSNTDETANDGIDNDGNGYIDDTEGWNFYDDSNTVYDSASLLSSAHGTHIAGIIAAENEDYNVRLMPLRVFGDSGAYTSDIIDAIEYAEANGAKIVNCSFGSTENNTALEEAMENSGMLFVCAAGNARSDLAVTPIFPACFDLNNVISVTSTNSDGGLSYFSNYSANLVDITALGRDVYSTLSNGEYGLYSGTSMSAAQVSGAAAAVLVEQDDLDAGGLKDRLIVTADMLSNLQSTVTGGRQLNLSNAIAGAEQIQVIQNTPADDFDVNGYDPTQDELYELYSNSGDVIQVAEGYSHTLILKENGTVWAWGTNGYGQCGNGATSSTVILTQVIGLSNVVYISAGTNFSLAVKSDGTVWA